MRQSGPLVFVAIVLAAAFVSCGNSGKDRPRLGVAMRSFGDSRSVRIRASIETEAMAKAELILIDGPVQGAAQDSQVDALFERRLAALAVEPFDGKSVISLIAKAKARGLPLVFFDRQPSDEAMRSWDKLFFVGSRLADAGGAQAEILAELWKAKPSMDRDKDKILQYGWIDAGVGGSGPRQASFTKYMSAAGIKIRLMAEGDSAEPILAKLGGSLEALICADYRSTLATIEAMKRAGKQKPAIVVIGQGEPVAALADALASGVLAGTVCEDNASVGKAVFALAYALARRMAPAWTGWRLTDAKYVWVPYMKFQAPEPTGRVE